MRHLFEPMIIAAQKIIEEKTDLRECNLQPNEIMELKRELYDLLDQMNDQLNQVEVSMEDEIFCFKVAKPYILGRLLFLDKIQEFKLIELIDSIDSRREYYIDRINHIDAKMTKEIDFYRYHRSGATDMDDIYYTRKNRGRFSGWRDSAIDRDPNFSTSHDFDAARIVCRELLFGYIAHQLNLMNGTATPCVPEDQEESLAEVRWTGSKSDLVELCYALLAEGAINDGNIKIKELIPYMERVFNYDCGGYYSAYNYIKKRKKDRLPFLTSLITTLNRKIENEDM